MAKVDPKVLEEMEVEQATIVEVKPGIFKGPWLPSLYDNRSECWRDNIAERNRKVNEEQGLNKWGQTPDQEKALKERVKVAEKIKEKAKIAEQMVLQAK